MKLSDLISIMRNHNFAIDVDQNQYAQGFTHHKNPKVTVYLKNTSGSEDLVSKTPLVIPPSTKEYKRKQISQLPGVLSPQKETYKNTSLKKFPKPGTESNYGFHYGFDSLVTLENILRILTEKVK